MVTVSSVASSDSTAYSVIATGILTFQMIHTISNDMHDAKYAPFPAVFGKSHSYCSSLVVTINKLNTVIIMKM